MAVETSHTPTIKLPAGPHGLPRELVEAVQRRRLLEAMAHVAAEEGYQRVTVRRLIARAGVSRKTYYELFGDKEECFLAAYDEGVERALRAMTDACAGAGGGSPAAGIERAIEALLDFLAGEPHLARLCVVEVLAAGPRARARRARTMELLARLVGRALGEGSSGNGEGPSPKGEPAGLRARSVVGAIHELVYDAVDRGELDPPRVAADGIAAARLMAAGARNGRAHRAG